MYLCRNVENAWCNFRSIFHSILEDVAPHRELKIRQQKDLEPWMTSDILENLRKRDELLQCYNKTKDKNHYKQFCTARNKVQRNINTAKDEYISGKIEENKKSPKKTLATFKVPRIQLKKEGRF